MVKLIKENQELKNQIKDMEREADETRRRIEDL
jgi:hypothetical protein